MRNGRTYRVVLNAIIALSLVSIPSVIHAQEVVDTTEYRPVIIDNADNGYGQNTPEGTVRYLSGNIRLRQDSTLFYGDSAVLRKERLRFWGNIIIQQNDTTAVFADSLIYSIGEKKAVLYKDVALQNGSRELFTDSLTYYLHSRKAYYKNGALLTDGEAVMKSRRGLYDSRARSVVFHDSVQLRHPEFYLRSSALFYRSDQKRAEFIAPTHIVQDSAEIYTEDGFYDLESRQLALTQSAQYRDGPVRATADSILIEILKEEVQLIGHAQYENEEMLAQGDYIRYKDATGQAYLAGNAYIKTVDQEMNGEEIWYNARTKELRTKGRSVLRDSIQQLAADTLNFSGKQDEGRASGTVQWRDTAERIEIRSDVLLKRPDKGLFAFGGRPLFLSELDGDTLFICSDTLHRYLAGPDSVQHMAAYYDVRIYKNDLQAVCDSLHYSASDSVFVLTGNPLMWSDTTQLSGDTLYVYLRNGAVDRVVMRQNAMIISTPDYLFFNQIQGKTITAWFEGGSVDYVDVIGNARAIYYLMDKEEAYMGVNKTESSSMRIGFEGQGIATIRFHSPDPKGNVSPMGAVNHKSLRLDGFKWLEEQRPDELSKLGSEWIVDKKLESLILPAQK